MKAKTRWVYLGAATLTLLFLGLIYAWSIFRAPFGELFPEWTVSQLSMTFTVSMAFFCLGGFAGGLLTKKLSFRSRMLISAAMLFAGFFAVSLVSPEKSDSSLAMLYVFYGVFGGGGVGLGYNAIIGIMNRWFPDKIGLASGIMLMGFGLGGLVLGSIVNSLIGSLGLLSVFKMLGIVIAIVCALAALIIKPASDEDYEVYSADMKSADKNDASSNSATDYTPQEMIKTAEFWLMIVWLVLIASGGLLVINSAANIAIAYGGSAALGMIVSLFNGAGRIIAGNNFDKRGQKVATLVNTGFMLVAGLFLALGGITESIIPITIGLICIGLSYGGCPTITSAFISRTYGASYFPTNFSIANFNLIAGATIGPMVSSSLLEKAGGNYITNFYTIIVFALVSLVIWIALNNVSKEVHR